MHKRCDALPVLCLCLSDKIHAGPNTLVNLAKADAGTTLDVDALVHKLVPEYVKLLQHLKELGVPEVLLMQNPAFADMAGMIHRLRTWTKADLSARTFGRSCVRLACMQG